MPTERFSTGNRHLQDCYGVRAGLIPLSMHQVNMRAHTRGCLGQQEAPYPSLVFYDCCTPADKSSLLCPYTQWKAFNVSCAVNFISIASLFISLPTQHEQPDSRQLIGRRARSCVCLPVSCRPSAAGGGDICRCLRWVPGSHHEHSDVWPGDPAIIPCHCGSVNHSPAPTQVWNVGLSASLFILSFLFVMDCFSWGKDLCFSKLEAWDMVGYTVLGWYISLT